ncbi:rhodanese-like domain-containing protein [Salipaludibacillus daqingensis]|uniref:rhodanese-like domain-containing protein n=1 Tax=Salipaludibacillus daqingensis TaxID=3041001 RepID=UPI0024768DBC|nr:rhodanese-like domain-containing protein [Salipaludibacillus daqingensis]
MLTKWNIWIVGFLLIVGVGCSDEYDASSENQANNETANQKKEAEQTEVDGFDELLEKSFAYMEDPQFEVMSPSELHDLILFGDPNDFLVLDVRDTTTFASANIPGSVNIPQRITPLENMVEQLPKDKEIIVVCFSGHQAGQTTAMLNTLGFNAKALQFGMGGYAAGTGAGSDIPKESFDFDVVTNGYESDEEFDLPSISYMSDVSIEQFMLDQSDEALEREIPNVMGAPDVKELVEVNELEEHQIIDIRLSEHYDSGHIPFSMNIPYDELFQKDQIVKLDPDKTQILIGYNGTDASQLMRLLNQLDYTTIPMAYGMSIWSGDQRIVGEEPIDFQSIKTNPVQELNYDLDGGEVETGCS